MLGEMLARVWYYGSFDVMPEVIKMGAFQRDLIRSSKCVRRTTARPLRLRRPDYWFTQP